MRLIHPAALVGLLLNLALGWMFFSVMGEIDASLLTAQEQEIVEAVTARLPSFRTLFIGLLLFQALALGLIVSGVKYGIGLAMVAGFFLLPSPGSLVYCIGALFSHDRVKYAAFAEAPSSCPDARYIFRAHARKKMLLFAGASMVLFLFLLLAKWGDVALLFFCLALAGLFFAFRSARLPALTLHDDYFTLTPGPFSRRLLLRYDNVGLATLLDDESIHLQISRPEGCVTLAWSLRTVVPEERRAALEELGAALAAHGVPVQ